MQAFLWIFFVFLNANPTSSKVSKPLPLVDALLSTLEKETWTDDQPCLQATLKLLRGVQNNTLWATWIWDSMQLPKGTFHDVTTHLGHFDQCVQFPWSSYPRLQHQYCVVEVTADVVDGSREFDAFDDAAEFYNYPSKYNRYHNVQEVGVCLPAACSPTSVAKIYRHIHSFTHLPDGVVAVDPRDCQTGSVGYSRKFYLFWCVVGILVATAILSTYLNKYVCNGKYPLSNLITQSFCIKRNYNGLFEANKNELLSLNGIRFLMAFCIVLIHDGYYTMQTPLVNARALDEFTTTYGGKFVLQSSYYVVDAFFTLSGLLLMRNLVTSNNKNLLISLLKRYLRLIGPFSLAILYISTALVDMAGGPYWPRATRLETDVCREHWWKSLLMLNNRPDTACHIVSWHMACDYQLSVLVTIIFYLYKRNRSVGLSVFSAVGVAMSLVRVNIRRNTTILYNYFMTHCHSAPYFIGVLMGYIMAIYNPAEYRKIIKRKWSIIMLFSSRVMCISMVCSGMVLPRTYHPILAAVVVPLGRVCWSIGICLLIGVCEYGSLRKLSNTVGWRGFIPLSKLTYCLYLIHPFLIQYEKLPGRTLGTLGNFLMIRNGCGVVILSCVLSLIFYLIIEAPVVNISNILLSEVSQHLERSETTSHNKTINNNKEIKSKIL